MAQTTEQQRIDSGCKCKECFGLAEVMLLEVGHDFGLPRAERPHDVRLHVVTTGESEGTTFAGPLQMEKPCTGTMTCACKRCKAERASRVVRKPGHTRQPWEAKPSRTAA